MTTWQLRYYLLTHEFKHKLSRLVLEWLIRSYHITSEVVKGQLRCTFHNHIRRTTCSQHLLLSITKATCLRFELKMIHHWHPRQSWTNDNPNPTPIFALLFISFVRHFGNHSSILLTSATHTSPPMLVFHSGFLYPNTFQVIVALLYVTSWVKQTSQPHKKRKKTKSSQM